LPHWGAQPILYTFSAKGYFERKVRLSARSDTNFTIVLVPDSYEGKEIVVEADRSDGATEFHMPSISDVTIYESKKSEQILLEELPINRASNTARQIYSRVAGINVWENDGSGVQLNIGARGLSPNRTSNFNTRQNGYDISADALGYPESYYTPPAEALEKIEVIRGASSLQYGTQFGGMLNFSIHKPTLADTTLTIESLQSAGSFGMLSTFNSINTRYKSIGIYGYYQSKKGNGWRPNSQYSLQNIYVARILVSRIILFLVLIIHVWIIWQNNPVVYPMLILPVIPNNHCAQEIGLRCNGMYFRRVLMHDYIMISKLNLSFLV
jgi:Fe(3+) dicitrate transport protein